jgi:hypothetical protein
MQPTKLSVKSLTNHFTIPHKHSSDQRVWAHVSPPTFGQLQGSLQV